MWALSLQLQLLWDHEYDNQITQKTSFIPIFPIFSLLHVLCFLLWDGPWALKRIKGMVEVHRDVPQGTEHSLSFSQHINCFASPHWLLPTEKAGIWQMLRAHQAYGHEHKYVAEIWTFSKMVITTSTLGTMNLTTTTNGLLRVPGSRASPMEQASKLEHC